MAKELLNLCVLLLLLISLLFSCIEMLTDGVDWWHLSRGLGIHHPERLVKVSQESGVAGTNYPHVTPIMDILQVLYR